MRHERVTGLLLTAITACGGGHLLNRSETIHLQPQEGLAVIAVDASWTLTLTFCRDADVMRCTDVGPLAPGAAPAVVQVTAGRYCLMKFIAATGGGNGIGMGGVAMDEDIPADRAQCFDVPRGVVAYPGHYVFRTTDTDSIAEHVQAGWEHRETVLHDALAAAYPALRAMRVQPVDVTRNHVE